MSILFAFAAVVQVNDPDPIRWIAIYIAACVASIAAATRRDMSPVPFVALGAVALAWAVLIVAGGPRLADYLRMFEAWEMKSLPIEEAREASGLLIVGAWMAVLAGWTLRASRRQRHAVRG